MKKPATLIIVLALTLMITLPLFASGVTEGGPHFKELDLNTVTLEEMEKETVDLKALGIRGFSQKSIINLLKKCYEIE